MMKKYFLSFITVFLAAVFSAAQEGTSASTEPSPPAVDEGAGETAAPPVTVVEDEKNAEIKKFVMSLKKATDIPQLRIEEQTGLNSFFYNNPEYSTSKLERRPDPFRYYFVATTIEIKTEEPVHVDVANTGSDHPGAGDGTAPTVPDVPPETIDITPRLRTQYLREYEKVRRDYMHAVNLMSQSDADRKEARSLMGQVANECTKLAEDIAQAKPKNKNETYNSKDEVILRLKSRAGRLHETVIRMESRMAADDQFHDLKFLIRGVVARAHGAACIVDGIGASGNKTDVFEKGDSIPNKNNKIVIVSEIHDDYVVFDFQNQIKVKLTIGEMVK